MNNIVTPNALIFDWDDTITRNWWRVFQSMNKTRQHFGYDVWSEDEAKRQLGASGRDVFPIIFGSNADQGSKVYYEFLQETLASAPEVIPGTIEAIKSIASNTDLYMGVLSNKRGEYLREEVAKLGLDDCFSVVIGANDAEEDKPSTKAMDKALLGSGIQKDESVWFIGDSHVDMQCAYNNACTAVMIETKLPPDDMLKGIEPHLRFADCTALSEYLFDSFSEEIKLDFKSSAV